MHLAVTIKSMSEVMFGSNYDLSRTIGRFPIDMRSEPSMIFNMTFEAVTNQAMDSQESHHRILFSFTHDCLSVAVLTPLLLIFQQHVENFGRQFASDVFRRSHRFSDVSVRFRAEKKVGESLWRFLFYTFMLLYGQLSLRNKAFYQDPGKLWGDVVVENGKTVWHLEEIPSELYVYYTAQISFYLGATWQHLRKSNLYSQNKDAIVILIHHVIAVVLLVISLEIGVYPVGCMVLLLHDWGDPFLELAKLFKYFNLVTLSTISFTLFFVTYHVTRLYIYPVYILHSCVFDSVAISQHDWMFKYVFQPFGVSLLCVILLLNVVWSSFILKMLFKILRGGQIRDNRSEDDEVD